MNDQDSIVIDKKCVMYVYLRYRPKSTYHQAFVRWCLALQIVGLTEEIDHVNQFGSRKYLFDQVHRTTYAVTNSVNCVVVAEFMSIYRMSFSSYMIQRIWIQMNPGSPCTRQFTKRICDKLYK